MNSFLHPSAPPEFHSLKADYNGITYRSRLEARWAMFFDLTKTPFLYEPEGFSLNRIRYLPDFYLPHLGYWVEVKGKPPTEEEKHKGFLLTQATRKPIIFLSGHMGFNHNHQNGSYVHAYKMEVIYGFNRPHPQYDSDSQNWTFMILFGNGIVSERKSRINNARLHYSFSTQANPKLPDNYTGSYEDIKLVIESDCESYLKNHGRNHPRWKYGYSSSSHGYSPFWVYRDGMLAIEDGLDENLYPRLFGPSDLEIGGYLNKVACHSFKR